jgi:cytidylate kinase
MIIAIDGPAASGKGTLGKRLAAHHGLRHLDTGPCSTTRPPKCCSTPAKAADGVAGRRYRRESALSDQLRGDSSSKIHAVGETACDRFAIPDCSWNS